MLQLKIITKLWDLSSPVNFSIYKSYSLVTSIQGRTNGSYYEGYLLIESYDLAMFSLLQVYDNYYLLKFADVKRYNVQRGRYRKLLGLNHEQLEITQKYAKCSKLHLVATSYSMPDLTG